MQIDVFLGAAEMIVDATVDPLVSGMGSYAGAHDTGDNLKCVFKQFRRFTSCPLAVFGPGYCCSLFRAPGVLERFENPALQ
jgi:hypothetical protein